MVACWIGSFWEEKALQKILQAILGFSRKFEGNDKNLEEH